MDNQQLSDNITKLLQRVRRGAEKSQFGNSDILVLAASKTRPESELRAAHACGLSHFGESYLQEALPKIAALSDLGLTWHFIGPLQANKTRAVAEHFHWVHSVDRARIAHRLDNQRPAGMPPLQVCIQVNISGEASKSGVDPAGLPELVKIIRDLPRLTLRGLMAIPAASDDPGEQRSAFRRLRETLSGVQALCPGMDTLSMGMSDDLESAIGEGATIVRVGTAIFGARGG